MEKLETISELLEAIVQKKNIEYFDVTAELWLKYHNIETEQINRLMFRITDGMRFRVKPTLVKKGLVVYKNIIHNEYGTSEVKYTYKEFKKLSFGLKFLCFMSETVEMIEEE